MTEQITPYTRLHLIPATVPMGRGEGRPCQTISVDPEDGTHYCNDCDHSGPTFHSIVGHRRSAHPKGGGEGADERSLRAQVAAHTSWAKTPDRAARTSKARAAHDAKFLAEAGGDEERAEHLRKAHFARLALASAKARRLASEARKAEAALREFGGDR